MTIIPLYAQNIEVIDSLKKIVHTSTIKEKIQSLNQLGWEYRLSKPDSTIYYSQQAYDLALQYNKYTDASVALNYMGIANGYKGEYIQSFFYYEQSLELFSKHLDSIQLAHAYNNIGRLLFSQADMASSYEYFNKALLIFQQNNNIEGVGYTFQSLVRIYETQGNFPKALEISKKVLEIREQTKNTRGQISSHQEIAGIYMTLKNYTSAQHHLDKAESIAIANNDIISLSEIDLSLSKVFYHLKNFDEALNYCNKALIPVTNNEALLLEINLQLGKIFYSTKQYSKAENYLLGVVSKANKIGLIEPLSETFKYLYLTCENQGRYDESLNYFKSFVLIKDSIYDVDMARTIEKLENRLEIEKKDKENKLLKSREEQNQQLFASEKNKSNAYMAAMILAIIAVALLLIYLRQHIKHEILLTSQKEYIEKQNQKINEQNQKLEKRNVDLAELNTEKDNLMNIVAHDLKSPLKNLKGLSQLVEMAGTLNQEQKKYIEIMKQVSDKGAQLTTDILDVNAFTIDDEEMLHPEYINVHIFLQSKIDSFKTDSESKNISIQSNCEDKNISIETDENSLSRILDNLISNSIKYSPENTAIHIKSSVKNNHLSIIVADEGPGFSEEDKKHVFKKFTRLSAQPTGGESSNGLGLAIVKALINRLHGEISLHSEHRKGATFTIGLPLKFIKKDKNANA
ncbi:MAG: tetratricopeptide repeat-containing sensor histidine kinase [Cyclobacteriaceae bacterium]|nr:tetratricopeptide repeat-containing sensor histidine kinase [Cyclobacteriaceae bacterium]